MSRKVIGKENEPIIKYEPIDIIKKLFHKPDEIPENNWICVFYDNRIFYDMLYQKAWVSMEGTKFEESIPPLATGGDGCEIIWEDIDYWIYQSDVDNILGQALRMEKRNE